MFWVSGGQYTDSVHNRTNLAKVTPGLEVSTPIQYTTAQALRKLLKRTLVKKSGPVPGPWGSPEVSTPIQYTTAQDMFGCRHGRFSIQPHKICLGVGIDGSVHNRTRYVLGVDMDGSVHNRTNLAKVTLGPKVSTPVQYTTAQTLRKAPWFRRSVHR